MARSNHCPNCQSEDVPPVMATLFSVGSFHDEWQCRSCFARLRFRFLPYSACVIVALLVTAFCIEILKVLLPPKSLWPLSGVMVYFFVLVWLARHFAAKYVVSGLD